MDKNQSELLFVLEKTQNITKAADELGKSQPAISKTLQNIERMVGFKIFLRLPRTIELTKEGKIYIQALRDALSIIDEARNTINKLNNSFVEEISIGVHPIIGKNLIPNIDLFFENYKEFKLIYCFDNSRKIIEEVLKNKLDLGIVADAKNYPDLVIKPLWKEYIGLYSFDGKPKSRLLYNPNMIFSNKIIKFINCHHIREISDYEYLASILSKSEKSMGLLPNSIGESGKKLKLINRLKSEISISLVYRSDKNKNKSFMKVIEVIRQKSNKHD